MFAMLATVMAIQVVKLFYCVLRTTVLRWRQSCEPEDAELTNCYVKEVSLAVSTLVGCSFS